MLASTKAQRHAAIKQATGFPGSFGGGAFYNWLRANHPAAAAFNWGAWADKAARGIVTPHPAIYGGFGLGSSAAVTMLAAFGLYFFAKRVSK